MYQLEKVSRTYQQGKRTVKALVDVDLHIADGELVAIQGPTGGGKSTLLQMLGGLDRPTSGSVRLGASAAADDRAPDSVDLATLGDTALTRVRAERIGFVFQNFNLIPTLTAQENVETALVPTETSPADRAEKARAALASVGLSERADHLPGELSGGQQQRVAIARALVKEPTVLLADEPTGNLDEATRDEIVALLEGLWKEKGLTVVMVTHDSTVARRAKRRLRIADGKVTQLA
ncbi:MAG: ABC transporter ATP-binding protein [Promicromonosporaceae bacterium]|nr:ABC transporter ATP-binding protein [Promicromonosporaceae bacterium]